MEALIAVQIVATGLAGLRFLRQSHRHMTEDFIEVYGGYAIKLLKLQAGLLQALDRHRRGHRQTVEVHHVHLYPGSQGVIGVVNPAQDERRNRILSGAQGAGGVINSGKDSSDGEDGSPALDNSSPSPSESQHVAEQIAHAPQPAVWSPNAEGELVQPLKHGLYTAEAIARRREISALMRAMKALARNN
jgi:hypothetical protein